MAACAFATGGEAGGAGGVPHLGMVVWEPLATTLAVDDLARLGEASRYFHARPWPRLEILWRKGCKLAICQEDLLPLLERLGERLRRPAAVRAASAACGPAEQAKLIAWAEENGHRAAWLATAVLSSGTWDDHADGRSYIARFLPSGLAAQVRSPHLSLSAACVIRELVQAHMKEDVMESLRGAGVADMLEHLVQHGPPPTQRVALEAIETACDLGCDPLGVADNGVIPAVISLAQSGEDAHKLGALKALFWLAHFPENFQADDIRVFVDLLAHNSDTINDAAAAGMYSLLKELNGEVFARKAAEHGGVPLLLALLRNKKIERQHPLFCLEEMTGVASIRDIGLRHGILPLLFESLRDETDATLSEVILAILRVYMAQLPEALLKESAAQRKGTIRSMVALARARGDRHTSAQARQLLERVAQESPQMGRLMRQVGFRA